MSEKQYKCNIDECHYSCDKADTLKKHKQNKHPGHNAGYWEKKAALATFKCFYCNALFTDENNRNAHVRKNCPNAPDAEQRKKDQLERKREKKGQGQKEEDKKEEEKKEEVKKKSTSSKRQRTATMGAFQISEEQRAAIRAQVAEAAKAFTVNNFLVSAEYQDMERPHLDEMAARNLGPHSKREKHERRTVASQFKCNQWERPENKTDFASAVSQDMPVLGEVSQSKPVVPAKGKFKFKPMSPPKPKKAATCSASTPQVILTTAETAHTGSVDSLQAPQTLEMEIEHCPEPVNEFIVPEVEMDLSVVAPEEVLINPIIIPQSPVKVRERTPLKSPVPTLPQRSPSMLILDMQMQGKFSPGTAKQLQEIFAIQMPSRHKNEHIAAALAKNEQGPFDIPMSQTIESSSQPISLVPSEDKPQHLKQMQIKTLNLNSVASTAITASSQMNYTDVADMRELEVEVKPKNVTKTLDELAGVKRKKEKVVRVKVGGKTVSATDPYRAGIIMDALEQAKKKDEDYMSLQYIWQSNHLPLQVSKDWSVLQSKEDFKRWLQNEQSCREKEDPAYLERKKAKMTLKKISAPFAESTPPKLTALDQLNTSYRSQSMKWLVDSLSFFALKNDIQSNEPVTRFLSKDNSVPKATMIQLLLNRSFSERLGIEKQAKHFTDNFLHNCLGSFNFPSKKVKSRERQWYCVFPQSNYKQQYTVKCAKGNSHPKHPGLCFAFFDKDDSIWQQLKDFGEECVDITQYRSVKRQIQAFKNNSLESKLELPPDCKEGKCSCLAGLCFRESNTVEDAILEYLDSNNRLYFKKACYIADQDVNEYLLKNQTTLAKLELEFQQRHSRWKDSVSLDKLNLKALNDYERPCMVMPLVPMKPWKLQMVQELISKPAECRKLIKETKSAFTEGMQCFKHYPCAYEAFTSLKEAICDYFKVVKDIIKYEKHTGLTAVFSKYVLYYRSQSTLYLGQYATKDDLSKIPPIEMTLTIIRESESQRQNAKLAMLRDSEDAQKPVVMLTSLQNIVASHKEWKPFVQRNFTEQREIELVDAARELGLAYEVDAPYVESKRGEPELEQDLRQHTAKELTKAIMATADELPVDGVFKYPQNKKRSRKAKKQQNIEEDMAFAHWKQVRQIFEFVKQVLWIMEKVALTLKYYENHKTVLKQLKEDTLLARVIAQLSFQLRDAVTSELESVVSQKEQITRSNWQFIVAKKHKVNKMQFDFDRIQFVSMKHCQRLAGIIEEKGSLICNLITDAENVFVQKCTNEMLPLLSYNLQVIQYAESIQRAHSRCRSIAQTQKLSLESVLNNTSKQLYQQVYLITALPCITKEPQQTVVEQDDTYASKIDRLCAQQKAPPVKQHQQYEKKRAAGAGDPGDNGNSSDNEDSHHDDNNNGQGGDGNRDGDNNGNNPNIPTSPPSDDEPLVTKICGYCKLRVKTVQRMEVFLRTLHCNRTHHVSLPVRWDENEKRVISLCSDCYMMLKGEQQRIQEEKDKYEKDNLAYEAAKSRRLKLPTSFDQLCKRFKVEDMKERALMRKSILNLWLERQKTEALLKDESRCATQLLVGPIFRMLHEDDQYDVRQMMRAERSKFAYQGLDQAKYSFIREEHMVVGKSIEKPVDDYLNQLMLGIAYNFRWAFTCRLYTYTHEGTKAENKEYMNRLKEIKESELRHRELVSYYKSDAYKETVKQYERAIPDILFDSFYKEYVPVNEDLQLLLAEDQFRDESEFKARIKSLCKWCLAKKAEVRIQSAIEELLPPSMRTQRYQFQRLYTGPDYASTVTIVLCEDCDRLYQTIFKKYRLVKGSKDAPNSAGIGVTLQSLYSRKHDKPLIIKSTLTDVNSFMTKEVLFNKRMELLKAKSQKENAEIKKLEEEVLDIVFTRKCYRYEVKWYKSLNRPLSKGEIERLALLGQCVGADELIPSDTEELPSEKSVARQNPVEPKESCLMASYKPFEKEETNVMGCHFAVAQSSEDVMAVITQKQQEMIITPKDVTVDQFSSIMRYLDGYISTESYPENTPKQFECCMCQRWSVLHIELQKHIKKQHLEEKTLKKGKGQKLISQMFKCNSNCNPQTCAILAKGLSLAIEEKLKNKTLAKRFLCPHCRIVLPSEDVVLIHRDMCSENPQMKLQEARRIALKRKHHLQAGKGPSLVELAEPSFFRQKLTGEIMQPLQGKEEWVLIDTSSIANPARDRVHALKLYEEESRGYMEHMIRNGLKCRQEAFTATINDNEVLQDEVSPLTSVNWNYIHQLYSSFIEYLKTAFPVKIKEPEIEHTPAQTNPSQESYLCIIEDQLAAQMLYGEDGMSDFIDKMRVQDQESLKEIGNMLREYTPNSQDTVFDLNKSLPNQVFIQLPEPSQEKDIVMKNNINYNNDLVSELFTLKKDKATLPQVKKVCQVPKRKRLTKLNAREPKKLSKNAISLKPITPLVTSIQQEQKNIHEIADCDQLALPQEPIHLRQEGKDSRKSSATDLAMMKALHLETNITEEFATVKEVQVSQVNQEGLSIEHKEKHKTFIESLRGSLGKAELERSSAMKASLSKVTNAEYMKQSMERLTKAGELIKSQNTERLKELTRKAPQQSCLSQWQQKKTTKIEIQATPTGQYSTEQQAQIVQSALNETVPSVTNLSQSRVSSQQQNQRTQTTKKARVNKRVAKTQQKNTMLNYCSQWSQKQALQSQQVVEEPKFSQRVLDLQNQLTSLFEKMRQRDQTEANPQPLPEQINTSTNNDFTGLDQLVSELSKVVKVERKAHTWSLTIRDYQCKVEEATLEASLSKNKWVSNFLMQDYVAMLNSWLIQQVTSEGRSSILMLGQDFYEKLQDRRSDTEAKVPDYQAAASSLRGKLKRLRANKSNLLEGLMGFDIIAVPILDVVRRHWLLLTFQTKTGEITIVNPKVDLVVSEEPPGVKQGTYTTPASSLFYGLSFVNFIKYLQQIYNNTSKLIGRCIMARVQQQENNYDCGVFVMLYLNELARQGTHKALTEGPLVHINDIDSETLRKILRSSIESGKLIDFEELLDAKRDQVQRKVLKEIKIREAKEIAMRSPRDKGGNAWQQDYILHIRSLR